VIRYLNLLFLVVVGLCLLTVALANRDMVMLRLLPDEMADFLGFGWTLQLPLFIVVLASIVAGLVIGFVWEWLREHKHRAAAAASRREAARLEREVSALRQGELRPQDEIIALLDQPRKTG
jgi:lipopolysaccharide assembly protein A